MARQFGYAGTYSLATVNRHGLIAGATGTGKTKTIQQFAESLSEQGVNVLLMDIKRRPQRHCATGHFNAKIEERHQLIGQAWQPLAAPVELFSISEERVSMRATVSEGPCPVLQDPRVERESTGRRDHRIFLL